MKNGMAPLMRRVTSFNVAGAGEGNDIEITYGGAGEQILVQKDDDGRGRLRVGISVAQLPYVIRALTTLQAEIGETEEPLAPSRTRTDVQGAIFGYLANNTVDAITAADNMVAALGLSRDQVVSTLGRLKKNGRIIETDGHLAVAPT